MGFEIEKDLENGILHVSAFDKVTAEDYEKKLLPAFKLFKDHNKKIHLLIFFRNDFKGYTAGAAWEDAKFGLRYMTTLERCAVVSDINWVRHTSHIFGSLIPCSVATYKNEQLTEAKEWLRLEDVFIDHKLDEDKGVLNIEITGVISSLNMEVLSHTVDSYLDRKGELNALVIHAKYFPGWENLGSMISHISFVKNHHKKIKKVALVVDGSLIKVVQKVAKQFVKAKVKHFDYDELDEANEWARD